MISTRTGTDFWVVSVACPDSHRNNNSDRDSNPDLAIVPKIVMKNKSLNIKTKSLVLRF